MVGKQAMNSILEMFWPMIFKRLNSLRVKAGLAHNLTDADAFNNQWTKDYRLVAWGGEALFSEYLEMGNAFILFQIGPHRLRQSFEKLRKMNRIYVDQLSDQ